jgi:hypothetical protein
VTDDKPEWVRRKLGTGELTSPCVSDTEARDLARENGITALTDCAGFSINGTDPPVCVNYMWAAKHVPEALR